MDLTNQTELYLLYSVDPDTNILTLEIQSGGSVTLGSIVIENKKFEALINALAIISKGRATSMQFKGGWDASTNTPQLADVGMTPAPLAGDAYYVTKGGTQDLGSGSQPFYDGNYVIYTGTFWKRSSSDIPKLETSTAYDVQSNVARVIFR